MKINKLKKNKFRFDFTIQQIKKSLNLFENFKNKKQYFKELRTGLPKMHLHLMAGNR